MSCSASAGLYALPDWAKQCSVNSAMIVRSEFSLREPPLDLVEAVESPERLIVDKDERRAEDAARHRPVDLALQRGLDLGIVDRRARGVRIDPVLRGHGHRVVRTGDVDVVAEIGVE